MRQENPMPADFSFLIPMALTAVIEMGVGYLLGIRSARGQLLIALANIVTNPLLHLIAGLLYLRMDLSVVHVVIYLVLEPLVILLEGWIYRMGLDMPHPYRNSLILNTVTIAGGLLWMLLSH